MSGAGNTGKSRELCQTRVDRVQFRARQMVLALLLKIGFVCTSNYFVRSLTSIKTYLRVMTFRRESTATKLFIQYEPACAWLWLCKGIVIPHDVAGTKQAELTEILHAFGGAQLLAVEVALDFTIGSGVDREFICRHGLFGKSHPVGNRVGDELRFGSRLSATMVRAYEKPEVQAYRLEPELRRIWLAANGIEDIEDLKKLPTLLLPSRVTFVRINWEKLAKHLSRKGFSPERIIEEARARSSSIHAALQYLRWDIGVANVHRFLIPLPINRVMRKALVAWARRWAEEGKK